MLFKRIYVFLPCMPKRLLKHIFHRDHFIIVASAFLMLGLLRVITFNLSFLDPVAMAFENFSVTDIFFDIDHAAGEPETNDLITLVDMTELHSRGDIAYLLEEIRLQDPLCIGVDLIFEGEKDDPMGNEMLETAVTNLEERAVFAEKLTNYDSRHNKFTGNVRSFFSDRVALQEGYSNLNDNLAASCIRDFSIRQKGPDGTHLSFPAQIAARYDESVAEWDNDEVLINFRNVRFPVVPYNEVADMSGLINGHVVLVGTMTEEQDMHSTPLGKMSGLELQAYSLLTLLEHKGIREIPSWANWLIAFLLCYLLELTLDIPYQLIVRKRRSVVCVFLKESNVINLLMLFLWAALVCWLMYLLFIRKSISLSGGLFLILLTLVCESRELFRSLIKGLRAKYAAARFVETSIIHEND